MARKAFTLIELLIVISIIALLAAILFPVFARARENARRASCQSNLKQIAIGITQYAQDFDERLMSPRLATPSGNFHYAQAVQPYVKSYQIFRCPSGPDYSGAYDTSLGLYLAYGLNAKTDTDPDATSGCYDSPGIALAALNYPSELLLLTENAVDAAGHGYFSTWYDTSTYCGGNLARPTARHFEGANVAFADGHVKWLKVNKIMTAPSDTANWRLWEPSAS